MEHDPVPENLAHRTRPLSDHKGRAIALSRERRFRDLILGVTDYAIYMIDLDGIVTNWNAGAERAKGYRVDEGCRAASLPFLYGRGSGLRAVRRRRSAQP